MISETAAAVVVEDVCRATREAEAGPKKAATAAAESLNMAKDQGRRRICKKRGELDHYLLVKNGLVWLLKY